MEKTRLKNILKITNLSLIFCFIGLLVAGIIISTIDGVTIGLAGVKWVAIAVIGFVLFIDFLVIILYAGTALINKKDEVTNDEYQRELPKDVPPAIASLLLDYTIDSERDYTATIASLIAKGYIEINENESIRVFKWDKKSLLKHEIVVFEALTKDYNYDDLKFKDAVRRDAIKLGFVERVKKNYTYLIPIILLISLVWFTRPDGQDKFNPQMYFVFMISMVLLTLFVIIMAIYSSQRQPNTEKNILKRTILGTEKAKQLAGLKNFLHDYTMLKEKELQDSILYDEYIAYAIALGEANAIENLIVNNSKYRKLVYKKQEEYTGPIDRY